MNHELAKLHSRWDALFHGLGTSGIRHHEFDALVRHYREPHRGYHNLDHIAACLRQLDLVRHLAPDGDALEAAIWFHDVIYDPRGADNEGASAVYATGALSRLGADEPFRQEVSRLILLTRHNTPPADIAGQLMVDIDLSSLGVSPEEFDRNGQAIRNEFAHVDDATYKRTRAQIMRNFAARPKLYFTEYFRWRFEEPARANLRRAIAALEA
jgi:predicted metal-dependent HD superfamily phosphohydrolase